MFLSLYSARLFIAPSSLNVWLFDKELFAEIIYYVAMLVCPAFFLEMLFVMHAKCLPRCGLMFYNLSPDGRTSRVTLYKRLLHECRECYE